MIILRFDNRKPETPFLCFLFAGFLDFRNTIMSHKTHCISCALCMVIHSLRSLHSAFAAMRQKAALRS